MTAKMLTVFDDSALVVYFGESRLSAFSTKIRLLFVLFSYKECRMITPLSARNAGLTGMQQSRAVPTNMCLHFGHKCLVAPHHVIAQQQPSVFVPSSSRINRRQILVLFRHFRTKTDYVTWFPTYIFVPKLIMLHGFLYTFSYQN